MYRNDLPRPTGSTLQNQRLNRAIRARQLGRPEGLRTVARRSNLPRAGYRDLAIALTGGLLIFLLALLLSM